MTKPFIKDYQYIAVTKPQQQPTCTRESQNEFWSVTVPWIVIVRMSSVLSCFRFNVDFNGTRVQATVCTQDANSTNPNPSVKRKGAKMEIMA